MTQQRTPGGAPEPRRAEPIQPDRPNRGDKQERNPEAGSTSAPADGGKLLEQERTAVENVREGYK